MADFIRQYKIHLIIGGVIAAVVMIWLLSRTGDNDVEIVQEPPAEDMAFADSEELPEDSEVPANVFIEVKGAVKSPGVYEIPKDARVINALEMAEVLPAADLNSVNQSMKVHDELVIYVPLEGEETDIEAVPESPESGPGETVNINTATIEDLTALNGIGDKKAQRIIEHREANGLFMKKEDLMNISGIGEKTFESLEPYITID